MPHRACETPVIHPSVYPRRVVHHVGTPPFADRPPCRRAPVGRAEHVMFICGCWAGYLNPEQSGPGSSHRFPPPPRTAGPWGRLRTLRPVRGHPRARPPPSMGLCRGNGGSVDECFALALVEEAAVTVGGSHGGALSLCLFAAFGGWSEAFARATRTQPPTGVTLPRLTHGADWLPFLWGLRGKGERYGYGMFCAPTVFLASNSSSPAVRYSPDPLWGRFFLDTPFENSPSVPGVHTQEIRPVRAIFAEFCFSCAFLS